MNYPITDLSQAQAYLKLKESGQVPDPADFSKSTGDGSAFEPTFLELESRLSNLTAAGFGEGLFDAEARPHVHKLLDGLPLEAKLNPDFWRYLSAIRFYDIVKYRHPKTGKSKVSTEAGKVDGNWDNYGAKARSVRESLLNRLYVGASLAYMPDDEEDPYRLCAIKDVDLWQSHIIRVLSGENPLYVRALLQWFAGRDGWIDDCGLRREFEAADKKYKDFSKDHLRDLVKRVRRLRSNLLHELLEAEAVRIIVNDAARESFLNVQAWGKPKPT